MAAVRYPSTSHSLDGELLKRQNDVHRGTESIATIENVGKSRESLEDLMSLYKNLRNELVKVENRIESCLKTSDLKFNIVSQKFRSKNIEIHGLNCSNNLKTDKELVVKIGKYFGVELSVNDIEDIHLRRSKKHSDQMIVKFYSEKVPNMLLANRKTMVTNSHVFGNNDLQRIYINENLTTYYSNLYFQARQLSKQHGYKFVWVKAGKVYVRKNETSVVQRIDSIKAFEDIISKNP